MAIAAMARLALGSPRRAASHRLGLASAWVSSVLDLEEPTSHGTSGSASRRPRVDSRDLRGEPAVGRTSDPRRAPEVGNLGQSVDRCQVYAQAATTTVANVADLPHQSSMPNHGGRPVRRADGYVSAALCARDFCARASTDRPLRGHRSSDCGLDGTTAPQCPLQRTTRRGISCTTAIWCLQAWQPASRR
jgi:hypothetical protein